ncbi:MAG: rsfS, partial [Phycisphaerales bacterium]|nr:rsfS [Phycisphaerales bacterium]
AADTRAFAVEVARMLADTRCHQVTVLDVGPLSPVTDYFVVATGTSGRQMRSAADDVEQLGKSRGFPKLSRSGDESANWIILDCFNVVVHVFTQDARSYYDVDGLWGDAQRVMWARTADEEAAAKAAAAATPFLADGDEDEDEPHVVDGDTVVDE